MQQKLRFILGSSGAGKSETLFRELIQKAEENANQNYILVVPEQFTMATQKKVVMMHPRGAVANIDVVSFNRLCFRVFTELGISRLEILDDTGKSLILRKVIAEKADRLHIYKDKIHKHGFVEEMKSVLSELYMYGMDLERFEKMRDKVAGNHLISEKLQDIEVVYKAFQEYIAEKYITKEELLQKLCNVVERSEMIKHSQLYFDGFTGFTPVQNQLMRLLMQYSGGITVAVTVGEELRESLERGICAGQIPVSEQELFKMSKDMINLLLKMYTEQEGQERLAQIVSASVFVEHGGESRFGNNKELAHLEKTLFRGQGKKIKNDGTVQVLHFESLREETEYATDYIAYQVRNAGMRYRDFAVITGDMEGYGRILEDNLMVKNIPYFMDKKRSLILNPAVSFLRAVIEMVDRDLSYESVFQFLKAGITVLSEDETDLLENYVIAYGIRGMKRYTRPFQAGKHRMTEEELQRINEIREKFVGHITDIYEQLKGKRLQETEVFNVKKITEYLYYFLERFGVQDYLKNMESLFLERGELSLSKEYGQAYRYIIELFDKLAGLLGEETISLKEYKELLDAGFEEIKVGLIPLGMDQVIVGDIERTRLNDVKVLFVVGANDGVIPKHGKKSSLLSQNDRNYLKKMDIELSPTVREGIFIQKLYLYLNLTKPSEKLILSYADSGKDGKAMRPSYLIGEINRLYDTTERQEEVEDFDDYLKLSSKAFALKYLSEHLNKNHLSDMRDFEKELYGYFDRNEEYRELLENIREGVFFDNEPTMLGRKIAGQLAGEGVVKSVSRLEKYAACAYAHFLSYSLQLAEREKYEVSLADMGTLYHRTIELFSGEMVRKGYDFRNISEQERGRLVEQCVEKVTKDFGDTILQSSQRNAYLIRKITDVCKKTVWAMCEHVKQGKFTPENFEFAFREGRIDRVDTYEEDGKLYLKIIDYKSSNKKFELSDVFNGLQMQLVYYMGETLKIKRSLLEGKEIVPAGTFYFHIKSPYVECSESVEDETLARLLLREYKMSGLANDLRVPAVAMDQALAEEKAESDIISLKAKDIGKPASPSGLNSINFEKMVERVEQMIEDFTGEILEGQIEKNPYKKTMKTPCDYCSFKSVCGFDEREFQNHYKKLFKVSKMEDVLDLLNGEEEKDGMDQ